MTLNRKNQLVTAFKAGDALAYRHKMPGSNTTLEEDGVLEYANAPLDFEPDIQKLARDHGSLAAVAQAIEGYDESQMRILMYVLHHSHRLLRHGLRFGQVVWKNLNTLDGRAGDYLNCWFRAYVIALGPVIDGTQYVRLTGSLDNVHGSLMLVPITSVLTADEFREHRRELVSAGRLTAPVDRRLVPPVHNDPMADRETFPTIDAVDKRLVDAPDVQTDSEDEPVKGKPKLSKRQRNFKRDRKGFSVRMRG